jgi:hypothetical protein
MLKEIVQISRVGQVLIVSDSRSNKDEAWMLHSARYFHVTPNKE